MDGLTLQMTMNEPNLIISKGKVWTSLNTSGSAHFIHFSGTELEVMLSTETLTYHFTIPKETERWTGEGSVEKKQKFHEFPTSPSVFTGGKRAIWPLRPWDRFNHVQSQWERMDLAWFGQGTAGCFASNQCAPWCRWWRKSTPGPHRFSSRDTPCALVESIELQSHSLHTKDWTSRIHL